METAKNLLVRIAPAARLFLGMVLLAAGILKFGALRDFYEAVSQILMVPRFLSNLVALAVIVAETFCGLCLLLGLRSRIVTVTVSLLARL